MRKRRPPTRLNRMITKAIARKVLFEQLVADLENLRTDWELGHVNDEEVMIVMTKLLTLAYRAVKEMP